MHLARAAYGRPSTPARSYRQIEYDLFARVTKELGQSERNRKRDFPGFVKALNENLVMWRTLAIDVADKENGLPQQLRAQLFYLYEFTSEHTRKVLKDDASAEVLIDINTAVMRGLRGEGDTP
ncbi:flagellar biosynthesis regulator FlaF [Gemmobacter denitrificans]|uniref:Flagellar biosynthesis regulator FlaF n=1 Tax=Gemmobacter denitrificans TaxID=3123040 RepID=A0ABU8BVC5_9RHOB